MNKYNNIKYKNNFDEYKSLLYFNYLCVTNNNFFR